MLFVLIGGLSFNVCVFGNGKKGPQAQAGGPEFYLHRLSWTVATSSKLISIVLLKAALIGQSGTAGPWRQAPGGGH